MRLFYLINQVSTPHTKKLPKHNFSSLRLIVHFEEFLPKLAKKKFEKRLKQEKGRLSGHAHCRAHMLVYMQRNAWIDSMVYFVNTVCFFGCCWLWRPVNVFRT